MQPVAVVDAIGIERDLPDIADDVVEAERIGQQPADRVRLEDDPAEQDILARIRSLKAAGYTMRQIAEELNRQGYSTRRGTAWRFQYVAACLRAAA